MNYVFPMAGYGKRSSELGAFKPFIKIGDKEIFKHCVSGLGVGGGDTVLCIISKETAPEEASNLLSQYFMDLNVKHVTVVSLDTVPDGPALTIKEGVKIANEIGHSFDDSQVHVVNVDQIITYSNIELAEDECAMPLYFNNTGASCYVNLSNNFETIIDIREKDLISPFASAGAYLFGCVDLLLDCISWGETNPDVWVVAPKYDTKELFVGPCMNYALLNGNVCHPITVTSKIDLGSTNAINKVKDTIYEYSIR
jgi:hypothetical protein